MIAAAGVIAGGGRADGSEPGGSTAVAAAVDVQRLVDAMRGDLALSHVVAVEVVTTNPLKASVEPVRGAVRSFRLSIEQAFLEQLSEDELRAVVAHELGHVWIYTHHPYLQTEQLANTIAMRVVSRDSLDRVYGKIWADGAGTRALPRFPEQRAASAVDAGAPHPGAPHPNQD